VIELAYKLKAELRPNGVVLDFAWDDDVLDAPRNLSVAPGPPQQFQPVLVDVDAGGENEGAERECY
jgi:hypothetical protein